MSVSRLRAVLNAVGPPVDTVELAEMLWLAGHLSAEAEGSAGEDPADAPATQRPDGLAPAEGSKGADGSDPAVAPTPPGEPPSSDPSTESPTESSTEPSTEPSSDPPSELSSTTTPSEPAFPPPTAPKPPWGLAAEVDEEDGDQGVHDLRTGSEGIATPTAPMLSNPLAIQRALRPLKGRVPARRERVLDETATAARAADLPGVRPYRPVLTAADERWLSLALVLDTGPAMAMWRPLGRDLHDALLGLGAFRNLRVWHLADLESGEREPGDSGRSGEAGSGSSRSGSKSEYGAKSGARSGAEAESESGARAESGAESRSGARAEPGAEAESGSGARAEPGAEAESGSGAESESESESESRAFGVGVRTRPGGPVLDPSALLDPAGRQVVLLLSDCSGPAWWSGRAQPALHLWASHGPTAVVQPMAEHLWRRTAAAPVAGRARTVRPGAPNTGLRFTPYDGGGFQPPGTIPVPVLEIAPDWLADWARLITATGGPEQPTSVIHVGDHIRSRSEAVTAEQELPIRERVQRFHATASPEAAELAAHVAVSVPILPVMRLIQHRMVPGSGPAALAEVLLSGLFQPVDADRGVYGFVPGARGALLETLPRSVALAMTDVLKQLSDEIERRAGSAAETFRSLLVSAAAIADRAAGRGDAGAPGASGGGTTRTFALVSKEALRLLSHRASAPDFGLAAVGSPAEPVWEEEFDDLAPEAPRTPVVPPRPGAEPSVVLVLGEVHVSLLPNSTRLPEADVVRLLSIIPGQPVLTTHRPTQRVVSPETLYGVDCYLPSFRERPAKGKGTSQTHVVAVGGIALLGSSQVRVAYAPGADTQEWSWYLERPGMMMVPGDIDADDVAEGIREGRKPPNRLDLGSIIERTLDEVRRSSLLDGQVPVRAGMMRVRWVVMVVDSRSGPPAVDVVVEPNEQVLTVRMVGRLDELPTMTRFCEELALHHWLLLILATTSDLENRTTSRPSLRGDALEFALEELVPLWAPPAYLDSDMRALWNALEERAALTRQFDASVVRIRDQLLFRTMSLLDSDDEHPD